MQISVHYVELMIATLVFVLTPGLGVAIILSRTIADGLWRGCVVGVGLVLGDMTYAVVVLLAFTGLADMIAPYLFYVRICGAGYLIYLGIQQMRKGKIDMQHSPAVHRPIWHDLLVHWLVSVTNPKVMVFYMGFLPLFLPLGHLRMGQNIGVILSLFSASVLGIFITAFFAVRLKKYLVNDKTAPIINKIIGVLMCMVGVFLVM